MRTAALLQPSSRNLCVQHTPEKEGTAHRQQIVLTAHMPASCDLIVVTLVLVLTHPTCPNAQLKPALARQTNTHS